MTSSYEKRIQRQKERIADLEKQREADRELKAKLAAAHAETVEIHNKWFQTCEDVIKEKETELAKKTGS